MKSKLLDLIFGKGPTKSKINFWVTMINLRTRVANFKRRVTGPVKNVITWKAESDIPFQGDLATFVTFRKTLVRFGIPVGPIKHGYIVNGDDTQVYETDTAYKAILSYREERERLTRVFRLGVQLDRELDLIRNRKNRNK